MISSEKKTLRKIKKEILKIKSTAIEMKDDFDRLISRFVITKEIVCELECRVIETKQIQKVNEITRPIHVEQFIQELRAKSKCKNIKN